MRPHPQIPSRWTPPPAPVAHPSFRIVKELAGELARGEVSFPTFINATLKIRRALDDPQSDAESVARIVSGEPLLAAKLVQLANSAALAAPGKPVGDVRGAILRVGYSNVRAIAAALAMSQLVVAKDMQPFLKRAEAVWRHSLEVAAIAYVLARQLTKLNPDEALFAGLVHDIGRFYLLSKVSHYEELTADVLAVEALLDDWHAQIGHALLGSFGVSDAVLDAVAEHESPRHTTTPKTLTELIVLANRLGNGPNPINRADANSRLEPTVDSPELHLLLEEAAPELLSLVAALRA